MLRPARLSVEYVSAGLDNMLGRRVIRAYWSRIPNWGDALNEFLIPALSGMPVQFTRHPRLAKYLVVGSIISRADSNTVVWGSGAISADVRLSSKPKKVCAVRGPLTRRLLIAQGIDVPEIYGDPALLMPRLYNPDLSARYDVGVIPHHVDRGHPWLENLLGAQDVSVIDVECDTLQFIRNIKQCRRIVSSSLHGLICADAYGIPSTWVEFSNRVIGDGFKFKDYFASIGRSDYRRIQIREDTTLDSIIEDEIPYRVNIDLDGLLEACPFRRTAEGDV